MNDLTASAEQQRHNRQIAYWLAFCAVLVFAMVILGGVTRLTHSGLSMVQWRPVTGFLPPLGEQAWQETFDNYKKFPEYQKINLGMTLPEFKSIFYYEYSHRVLGRIIGLVFAIPFLYFVVRKRVGRRLFWKLLAMLILGGLQGGLGWYMVKSGLVDRPDVSHYRLAAHLGAALAIYGFILWVMMDLLWPSPRGGAIAGAMGSYARGLVGAIFLIILSGALVAGLDAGFVYNTFPLMDGGFVPPDMFALSPTVANFLDNRSTVQFDHRLLAELLILAVLAFWWAARRHGPSGRTAMALNVFLGAAVVQVALGISTLLLVVPVTLAALHQAGALVLFAAAVWVAFELRQTAA